MFATLSRFRRQIAVLTALAMVASVLVAVPAVAADPKADYTATFDACGMAPSSGFEDVPSGDDNAGDIDCIAYYGITKGTSATTYSPRMSVTREQMALFLTRLAGLVGIEMASDPDDAGFADVGDLSAESQTAINQLADLDITKGTSTTTYSPADSVTRGQMALFISRLMEKMTPMMDGRTAHGYTPSKVVAVDDDVSTADKDETKKVMSPYTDLGSVTKNTYDAITNLYELGVASGVSDTAYGPSALITRASMAGFMAGVLDHSNARPAGISIQAAKTTGFGTISTAVAVSYRGDDFMPVADQSVKVFNIADVMKLTEDNTCVDAADCSWSDAEDLTDTSGNLFLTGTAADGTKNTYYAWIGEKNGDKFDADTSDHAMVTLSSTTDATTLKVTTDINKNSNDGATPPVANQVDMDVDNSVTVTVQLVDGNGKNVAKSGVKITVGLAKNTLTDADGADTSTTTEFNNPGIATLTTDDRGMATYTVSGPTGTRAKVDDRDRTDTVTFSATGFTNAETEIDWIDAAEALTSAKGSAPKYLLIADGKVSIRASINFYDQYGNPSATAKHRVSITVGSNDAAVRPVNSRGMASHRGSVTATKGTNITVTFTALEVQGTDGTWAAPSTVPTMDSVTVMPVSNATDDSTRPAADIDGVYADDNRFHIGGDLYTYDDGDSFLEGGERLTLAQFEEKIGGNLSSITTAANVQVVFYDDDGVSIFKLESTAS